MAHCMIIHSARRLDARGTVGDFWLASKDGTITDTGTGDGWRRLHRDRTLVTDAGGGWLTAGFIDMHQHGGGGADYEHGHDGIRRGLATHRAHGTTRSLLSLVSAPIDYLVESLATIATLADPFVIGSHLEGPFLAPSHRGAHDESMLLQPDPTTIARLIEAGGGTLRLVTLAPELPGAMAAIEQFVRAGVVVAIGHTDADAAVAREAMNRGATVLTHAFNGMNGIQHRAPGPVAVAVADERVTLELILDGIHVHPEAALLLLRAAKGRVALITDAMAAAGSEDGTYDLGGQPVVVVDGVARLAGGTRSIAGSTLTQDVALRFAIIRLGIDPVDAIPTLTTVPATALGIGDRFGLLEPGFVADAVLLSDDFTVRTVWAAGRAPAG